MFLAPGGSSRHLSRPADRQSQLGIGRRGRPSELDHRLFEREVFTAARIAPLANIAHAAVIILIGLLVMPPSLGAVRGWWVLTGVGLNLYTLAAWVPVTRRPESSSAARVFRQMIAVTLLFSALWTLAAALCFPRLPDSTAAVLTVAFAGVIGCGAMALSTSRAIGLTWVISISGGLAVTHAWTNSETLHRQAIEVLVYVAALSIAVVYLSGSFRARCVAEYAAEDERAKVGLLLDDFEGGSLDWLWETGEDGYLTRVSERFAEVAHLSRYELQSLTLLELLDRLKPEGAVSPTSQELRRALNSHRAFRALTVDVVVTGELRHWSLSAKPIGEPDRQADPPAGIAWRGVGSDITSDKRQRDEISRLATTDALTGLVNRHSFQQSLHALLRDRPSGRRVVLAILDLDNFKSVNDTLGHLVGDQLLAQLSNRFNHIRRGAEICARLGGDEFALVVAGTEEAECEARLDEYFSALSEPFTLAGALIEARGSLGYAVAPGDCTGLDDLVMAADLALFAAKDDGRNRIRRFDTSLREKARSRARALHELGLAIARDEFDVYYQPQVSFADDRVVGFEALVRWRHPQRGVLGPDEFIHVAEEAGLIVPIGRAVLRRACSVALAWPDHVVLGVNLSPIQLMSVGIVESIESCLLETGLAAARLEIEVTESAMVHEPARAALESLSRSGIRLAVDDFGTGYSSFDSLRSLPFDRVKIDRSFVQALVDDRSPRSEILLRAMIEMAAALGMEALAEGVETQAQWTMLRSLGCVSFQGFLEARPMSADRIPDYLGSADRTSWSAGRPVR